VRLSAGSFFLLTLAVAFPATAEDKPADRRTFFGSGTSTSKPVVKSAETQQKENLLELLRQQEALQEEVKQLRNTVEVQGHELNQLKNRQRTLYDDLDKRVREVEKGRGATAAVLAADASPGAATAAAPRTTTAAQQQEYDAAYALMKDGQYERAMKELRAFLAKHPSSGLADNAQYWIGECNYVLRNYKLALEEYTKVLNYTNASKLPDAMLKIGYVHYELAAWDKARKALTDVQERFPGTNFAKLAGDRLAKMKKEGH
jgi:tol-pal system protein YbgF